MNTDTGRIYQGAEIKAAQDRGEPVVPVSAYVAQVVEAGHRSLNRAERRRIAREERLAAKRAKKENPS